MAQPLPPNVQDFPAFPQPKTLMLWPHCRQAVLMEIIAGERKSSPMQFPTPLTALEWCEQHHAALWYQSAPDPAAN